MGQIADAPSKAAIDAAASGMEEEMTDRFRHRCNEPLCPFNGQFSSSSCKCHKTREQMMDQRIEELEAALKPFAKEIQNWDVGPTSYDKAKALCAFAFGDLRRAAELLK